MKRANTNSGLTLAELIVAMGVGALILVILAQGMGSLSQWSRSLTLAQQNSEKTSSLFRFIAERLIKIEPLQIETEDGPQVLFTGASNEIKFVVAETTYPAKPGLYEQWLQILEASPGDWQIILYRKPLNRLDQFAAGPSGQSLILFTYSAKPEFSFLGDNGWQEQWQTAQEMPKQIGFEIEGWPKIITTIPKAFPNSTVNLDAKPVTEAVADAR